MHSPAQPPPQPGTPQAPPYSTVVNTKVGTVDLGRICIFSCSSTLTPYQQPSEPTGAISQQHLASNLELIPTRLAFPVLLYRAVSSILNDDYLHHMTPACLMPARGEVLADPPRLCLCLSFPFLLNTTSDQCFADSDTCRDVQSSCSPSPSLSPPHNLLSGREDIRLAVTSLSKNI